MTVILGASNPLQVQVARVIDPWALEDISGRVVPDADKRWVRRVEAMEKARMILILLGVS